MADHPAHRGGAAHAPALPTRIGVVGAGTMGRGIAQVACAGGFETFMYDAEPAALEAARDGIRARLEKGAQRGRWSSEFARASLDRLRAVDSLELLADCELVIEAAPERIELKRDLFEILSATCKPEAILATNTSSIAVGAIAAAALHPENVVGMHFFNPPPVMRLLEVIPAVQTSAHAVSVARSVGEAMGKDVIVASDSPGFIVNRCGRPFYGEALRLLQERVADVEQIDRIARLGGGFPMGPFELMDLVGIDVAYDVARSFNEQSFGESRWKPSVLQAQMVATGWLGRKSGRGWYRYDATSAPGEDDTTPPPERCSVRTVAILGAGPLADGLKRLAGTKGFELRAADDDQAELIVDARPRAAVDPGGRAGRTPLLMSCAAGTLAARGVPSACGFNVLPPVEGSRLVELTRLPSASARTSSVAEQFFGALGLRREWVEDTPGLVLGRIVCSLVNEALFAIGEGVGSAHDIDLGVTLGLNHPRGSVTRGREIGFPDVLATIDGLWDERHEERYRAAPLLRRIARTGEPI